MGYLKIPNLYAKPQFLTEAGSKVYALEKIHGTSAHIHFKAPGLVGLFSGGAKHADFEALFDMDKLRTAVYYTDVVIYGEAYGGKMQGMRAVYGDKLRFIAFDVKFAGEWLRVPDAENLVLGLGLEFVSYKEVDNTLEDLNKVRDEPSAQAIRNNCSDTNGEGVVLRPIKEMEWPNGSRMIVKHKREDFRETLSKRSVNLAEAKLLVDAEKIADEYVVLERLKHVLDKTPCSHISETPIVIRAVLADIKAEAHDIVWTPEVDRAIGRKAAKLWKSYLRSALSEGSGEVTVQSRTV
jgi:hypothetical protein